MASWQSKALSPVLRVATAGSLGPDADIPKTRARINDLAKRFAGKAKNCRIEPIAINDVAAEWVRPQILPATSSSNEQQARPTILYLHGGGYVVCGLDTHRPLVARLAASSGADALMIDYRLAPEHPFPAGLEDAKAAYHWLLAQGTPPSQLVIAGDSAGGGLTLALLLALKEEGAELPAAAVTLSPWTDLTFSGWSHLTHAKQDPMLSLSGAMLAARLYLKDTPAAHPLASPLFGDYQGLPPLMIHVGSKEILLDDALRVADRAEKAGVPVSHRIWQGLPHVFQAFAFLPEAQASIAELSAFIRKRTGTDTSLDAQTQPALAAERLITAGS